VAAYTASFEEKKGFSRTASTCYMYILRKAAQDKRTVNTVVFFNFLLLLVQMNIISMPNKL